MIVKVISVENIESKDEIERVVIEMLNEKMLNERVNCIVSKGLFSVGDTGYFFKNGTKIRISENYPWTSSFLKVKKGVYKVRSLKYLGVVYSGLLMSLKEKSSNFYENMIVKNKKTSIEYPSNIPKYSEVNIRRKKCLLSVPKEKSFFSNFIKSFVRTNLYVKKYMPDSILIVCTPEGSFTKKAAVCENSYFSKIIKKENLAGLANTHGIAIYGNIFNGKVYISKIYDINAECFLTVKDLIRFCNSYAHLQCAYSGYFEFNFNENNINELENLWGYYEKFVEDSPNYMVIANNNGDMLRITKQTNSYCDFMNNYNFKFLKDGCSYDKKQEEFPFVYDDNSNKDNMMNVLYLLSGVLLCVSLKLIIRD